MRKRSWSLNDLRKSLEHVLEGMPAPSLPALKAWSRMGLLDDLDGKKLDVAARQIAQRIRSGTLHVRGPRKRNEREPVLRSNDQEEILALLREIAQKEKTGKTTKEDCAGQEEILRAIDQLDAVRKHVLTQLDDLRQVLLNQQVGATSMVSGSCGIDALEWHRLVSRVARIENMLADIAERIAPNK